MEKKEGEKDEVEERPVEKGIHDISLSVQQPYSVMIAKAKAKEDSAKHEFQFGRGKYYMQQAATKFGPESDALEKNKPSAR